MPQGEDETLFRIVNRSAAGGVNTRVFALDIQDDQLVEGQNIDASTPGQRVKRMGWEGAAAGFSKGPVLATSGFFGQGVSKELIVVSEGDNAADNLRLWSWDGNSSDWTLAATLTGYDNSTDQKVDLILGFDIVGSPKIHNIWINYNSSTVNGRYFWDGTDLNSTVSTGNGMDPIGNSLIPGHNLLTFGFGRAWATANGANQNNLFYSDVASWTATGWSTIQALRLGNGSDVIVGASPFRGREVIVWMQNSIESIIVDQPNFFTDSTADPTNWSREVVDTSLGSNSRRSVAPFGQDIYFADQYGSIRSIARTINDASQGVRSDPVSDPIDAWTRRINPAALAEIVCEAHDRWLLVGLPIDDATTPSHLFALDVARSFQVGRPTWDGPWTNLDPKRMVSFGFDSASDSKDERPTLYIGNATNTTGSVLKFFRGFDDGGSDIVYQEVSKRYSVDVLDLKKDLRRMRLFAVATANVTMRVELNPDAKGWQTLGFANLLGDSPTFPTVIPFDLGGTGVVETKLDFDGVSLDPVRDVQFRFTATTDKEVKLLGYHVYGFRENFSWGTC